MTPLLALLGQMAAEPTPAAVAAATTDAFAFWLAVLDRLVPILTPLAVAAAAYLTWLTRRELGEQRKEMGVIHEKVNGTASEMRDLAARAAHAEGKLEGVTETAPQVIEAVKPLVQPPPRTGLERTRATDGPPPGADPSSHLR